MAAGTDFHGVACIRKHAAEVAHCGGYVRREGVSEEFGVLWKSSKKSITYARNPTSSWINSTCDGFLAWEVAGAL